MTKQYKLANKKTQTIITDDGTKIHIITAKNLNDPKTCHWMFTLTKGRCKKPFYVNRYFTSQQKAKNYAIHGANNYKKLIKMMGDN